MKHPAVALQNISVSYNNICVLNNISVKVPPGVLLALVGPNGAGKTTLLKSIVGLVKPFNGTIELFGSVKIKNVNVAYLPQRSTIDWDFPVTAFDVVLMGTYRQLGWFRRPGKKERIQACKALSLVNLDAYLDTPINELSGGQQQRVFVARALCQDADLYLMDEPFVGVDMATEKALALLFKQLQAKGKTIVVVHHDLHTLQDYFDWVFMLNVKTVACGPIAQVLTNHHLHAAYGKPMHFKQADL